MEPLTRDDLTHALSQLMGFYGKKIDHTSVRFWLNAMEPYDPEDAKQAMLDYTKSGRYAPKPVDIIEIISLNRHQHRGESSAPGLQQTRCPVHIETAWRWFISEIGNGLVDMRHGTDRRAKIDDATRDRYLEIVNQQAKLYNRPDAIPDEYKLREVWR